MAGLIKDTKDDAMFAIGMNVAIFLFILGEVIITGNMWLLLILPLNGTLAVAMYLKNADLFAGTRAEKPSDKSGKVH